MHLFVNFRKIFHSIVNCLLKEYNRMIFFIFSKNLVNIFEFNKNRLFVYQSLLTNFYIIFELCLVNYFLNKSIHYKILSGLLMLLICGASMKGWTQTKKRYHVEILTCGWYSCPQEYRYTSSLCIALKCIEILVGNCTNMCIHFFIAM